jgi:hypothetical protein
MKKTVFVVICLLGFLSCNSTPIENDVQTDEPVEVKEIIEQVNGDNLINDKPKDKTNDSEKIENHDKIVKTYGEQWGFCECVIANDSINKATQKNLSDKDMDRLLERWDYVEQKCKEFLTSPNTTPEERLAHEKKVKKCLKNK